MTPVGTRTARPAKGAAWRVGALGVVVGGVLGCSGGDTAAPKAAWSVDPDAVTGGRARTDSARVDLYVDATVSMGGYVADPNSRYAQFLERLEAAARNTWKRADVHFYRFGQQPQEVGRTAFLAARRPDFYTERITGIDRVADCGDPRAVRVIVTDLFQSEGDVNAIVAQIKDRCFQRGQAAAILGVTSQFNGRVYDARVPAYPYASTANPATYRPFYALLFGGPAVVEQLLAELSERTVGGRLPYAVIGPAVVRDYAVRMAKAPGGRDFNPPTSSGPYEYHFVLGNGLSGGTVVADVRQTPAPGAFPVRADQLELVAYRRAVGRDGGATGDSAEARDVTLRQAASGGDSTRLTLGVNPPSAPGTYAYHLALRTGEAAGFALPPWVEQYSSTNPTPTADANKTLNLAAFARDMRRAASSVAAPRLAVWSMTVRKR